MHKLIIVIFFFLIIFYSIVQPKKSQADCEPYTGPAIFSLYKNRQAIFTSVQDANAKQRYKIEWFIGEKNMGSVIKKAGESFILK